MNDAYILLQGTLKIIKYFFPVFLFIIVGLAYIGWVERKEGQPWTKSLKKSKNK